MNSRFQQIRVVSENASDISTLLNVTDEQMYLQQCMSPEAVQQCIHGSDTNTGRVKILCEKMVKDLIGGNSTIYDSLCEYFLKRVKAYHCMHQRFKVNSAELHLEQQRTQLELGRSRETQSLIDKQSHLMPILDMTKINDLIQKVSEMKERLDECVPQLQPSLKTVSRGFPRQPPFPNPHSDEMRKFWAKESPHSRKQLVKNKCVPFLCNENGEYFVDWNKLDEQWMFGKYGGQSWSSSFMVQCSLLLPHQLNCKGYNDRVVNVELTRNGNSLIMKILENGQPVAYRVKSMPFKCHFHLVIKRNDGTSFTELRDKIENKVEFYDWTNVFQSGKLPFPLFSTTVAPSLRLTLLPLF